jgi:hypothetical protein
MRLSYCAGVAVTLRALAVIALRIRGRNEPDGEIIIVERHRSVIVRL